MVSMLIFDKNQKEMQGLISDTKRIFAYCSEDQLNILAAIEQKEVQRFIAQKDLLDMAFLDVTDHVGLEITKQIRKIYDLSELLLIADSTISPMTYMTPQIRAASLLLRPFTTEQCVAVIQQFFNAFYRSQEKIDAEQVFVIENRDGKTKIPFSQIYYLEVREKRLLIRLKEKEYSKYDTLENSLKDFPENFVRCHRSFAVNTNYIHRVKLSENMILLEDDIFVPLSRSYKPEIKKYVKGLRKEI